jgi:hypothetical protein
VPASRRTDIQASKYLKKWVFLNNAGFKRMTNQGFH